MTFFDFPAVPKSLHGTNEISKTSFGVPSDKSLNYWLKRFDYFKEIMEKVLLFQEIILEHNAILPEAQQGFGTVHRAAFRVEDRSMLEGSIGQMDSFRFRTSGGKFILTAIFGTKTYRNRKSYKV